MERADHFDPERSKHFGGDVFGARHWRRGLRKGIEISARGQVDVGRLIDVWTRTDRGDEARAEVAPVTQVRREYCADFGGAELQ